MTIKMKKFHLISVFAFGIALPVFLLIGAYTNLQALQQEIKVKDNFTVNLNNLSTYKKDIGLNGNDYAYLSYINASQSLEKTMVNKQILKVLVIQVGFAVISLGTMLLVLGINQGGVNGGGSFGDLSFDLQIGSSGIAVFLMGAVMVLLSGVLKNEFETVGAPTYVHLYAPEQRIIALGPEENNKANSVRIKASDGRNKENPREYCIKQLRLMNSNFYIDTENYNRSLERCIKDNTN